MPSQKPAKTRKPTPSGDRASVAMRVHLAARAVTNPPLPPEVERAALEIADMLTVNTREQAIRTLDLAWALVRPTGEVLPSAPAAVAPPA